MRNTRYFQSIVLLILTTGLLHGQQIQALSYEGILTDMEGQVISNRSFVVSFTVLDAANEEVYTHAEKSFAGEDGLFSLQLDRMDMLNGMGTYNFRISLATEGGEDWLAGGEFELDYSLTKEVGPGYSAFVIRRFEGLILDARQSGDIWQFTDLYPFAYLQSRFMISFDPRVTTAERVRLICMDEFQGSQAVPEGAPAPAPAPSGGARSRGIKGGFAVGGYSQDAGSDKKSKKDKDN